MSKSTRTASAETVEKPVSIFDVFETDADLEKQGFVLRFGEGIEIVIARSGGANKRFSRYHENLMRPYRTQVASGTLDEAVLRELLADSYSHSIVLGWKGVIGRDGNKMQFNKKNVEEVLLACPDLFDTIMTESQRMVNFQHAGMESDAKP